MLVFKMVVHNFPIGVSSQLLELAADRLLVGPPPTQCFRFVSWQDWAWQQMRGSELAAVRESVCHWRGIGSWQGHRQPNAFFWFPGRDCLAGSVNGREVGECKCYAWRLCSVVVACPSLHFLFAVESKLFGQRLCFSALSARARVCW